jgi:hypothetical protein
LEKLIYKEQIIVDEQRTKSKEQKTKNKEQSLKSLQLKEQGAEDVSDSYCHPQCFIYKRKQTLQKNKKLKKRISYVLLYQRSCITS